MILNESLGFWTFSSDDDKFWVFVKAPNNAEN
jgi:hypothetical protein